MAIGGLEVTSAFGSALEVGVDYPLTLNGLSSADARRVYVKTTASGSAPAVGAPDATARIAPHPFIVDAGLGYRF